MATKTYEIRPGVAWVNGRRVTGKTVKLTGAEAKFDLDHGRIGLPAPKRKKVAPEAQPDTDADE